MASTSSASIVASLPAKKRKASSASHTSSNSNQGSSNCSIRSQPTIAATGQTANIIAAATKDQQQQQHHQHEGLSQSALPLQFMLPCKKRKGSMDGPTIEASVTQQIQGPVPEPFSNPQNGLEEPLEKVSHYSSKVLPCKKRKESQDSSLASKRKASLDGADSSSLSGVAAAKNPLRKGSQDSSTFPLSLEGDLLRQRKGSQDSSLSFEWETGTARKTSDATTCSILKLDDDLLRTSADLVGDSKLEAATTLPPLLEKPPSVPSSGAALDHLEALGPAGDDMEHVIGAASGPAGAAITTCDPGVSKNERKESDADNRSDGSFGSSGHRLLMEAIMMSCTNPGPASGSHGPKSTVNGNHTASSSAAVNVATGAVGSSTHAASREQLESWGALSQHAAARDRLESWGGMSDLSLPHAGLLLDEDVKLAASNKPAANSIPSRISLERERMNSIASLSEFLFDASSLDGLGGAGSGSGIGSASVGSGIVLHASDLQAYVAAAVASVGDQLAELAGAVENAASGADDILDLLKHGHESETSSVSSLLIGAVSDGTAAARHATRAAKASRSAGPSIGRPRSWSTSSGRISVDYEAVQAAIDAAQAASGTFDIATITSSSVVGPTSTESASSSGPVSATEKKYRATSRRKLPIARREKASRPNSPSSVENEPKRGLSRSSKADQIRERARAVAGFKPPPASSRAASALHHDSFKTAPPLKKRARRSSNSPPEVTLSQQMGSAQTPVVSNRAILKPSDDTPIAPLLTSSSSEVPVLTAKSTQGPTNKKWEMMFDALVDFATERREEETKNMTAEEKSQWVWDGNVPTTFKTKDGKPLGRWVNNQRSAKSKGALKEEREDRLIAAGLKWSVLNSNTWNDMLEELRLYIEEHTKQGQKWDGNVPTNYQIRSRPGSQFQGEDRNLGRWVNRQRSLFQAGRLRKDRQQMLEQIGLKWSMLATISWECMYDTLVSYVEKEKKGGCDWDGNVPANHRTDDNPPRALGRWINRQRSAFFKNRLKDEYKEKLTAIGLKWSVHFRGSRDQNDDGDPDYDSDASEDKEGEEEKIPMECSSEVALV